jgi:hypothetical protein
LKRALTVLGCQGWPSGRVKNRPVSGQSRSGGELAFVVATVVAAEHGGGAGVEGDGAVAGFALGFLVYRCVAEGGELVGGVDFGVGEVDVGDQQAAGFSAA